MMAMNTQKVLVGGLAAGVVIVAVDFLSHMVLVGDRLEAEVRAVAPQVMENFMTTGATVTFIAINLVFGLVLAWLYAAIRPRFGAGPRTAVYAALVLWLVGAMLQFGWVVGGLMSIGTFAIIAPVWLIGLVGAALLAGRLYTEDAAA
jgi:hypothetical protein